MIASSLLGRIFSKKPEAEVQDSYDRVKIRDALLKAKAEINAIMFYGNSPLGCKAPSYASKFLGRDGVRKAIC